MWVGPRGVWDHINERRVGCGGVLKRERDLTTDVDTLIAGKDSPIYSEWLTEIMWDCSGTQTHTHTSVLAYTICVSLCRVDMTQNKNTIWFLCFVRCLSKRLNWTHERFTTNLIQHCTMFWVWPVCYRAVVSRLGGVSALRRPVPQNSAYFA